MVLKNIGASIEAVVTYSPWLSASYHMYWLQSYTFKHLTLLFYPSVYWIDLTAQNILEYWKDQFELKTVAFQQQ